jgi:putative endopeptidase
VQPGLRVNGKLTLGENIADIGGLKLAFAAYRALRADQGPARTAEGYTEDQQFFLAHAQAWCSKARPERERLQVQTDPHSPARFRVNGPVANLPEFAAAWQCKPGAPLAPLERCAVW